MAQKKFNIKQETNLADGTSKFSSAWVTCDETEIASFLALLEGSYTVMVEHSSGGSDSPVTSYNILEKVGMKAEGRANTFTGIYGSNGGLVVSNTTDADSLSAVLTPMHLFEVDATLKPLASSIRPVLLAGASEAPVA